MANVDNAPLTVSSEVAAELGPEVLAQLLTQLAAASAANAEAVAAVLPDPVQRWQKLLHEGPAWAGGQGQAQRDADSSFLRSVEDAATGVVPTRLRSFPQLVTDLQALSELGIDDSYGAVADTVFAIAEQMAAVLRLEDSLADQEGVVESILAAATNDGHGYFAFSGTDEYEYTPVGTWIQALPPPLREEVSLHVADELASPGQDLELVAWLPICGVVLRPSGRG